MESVSKFFKIMTRSKQGLAGLIMISLFLLMAIVGPMVIPLDRNMDFLQRYQLPSLQHPLGTDYLGSDVFSQIVNGSRGVLSIGFMAAIMSIVLGFIFGAIAGFAGGVVDNVISTFTQMLITIPIFPLQLIIASIVSGSNPIILSVVIAVLSWGQLARAVRAQILSLKQRDFVVIAKLMDLPMRHILFKEMLPNLVSYLATNLVLNIRSAINYSVALMVLGVSTYDPTHWGNMVSIANAQTAGGMMTAGIFYLFVPITFLVLLQLSLMFFAHGLDEALNPRLRT